MSKTLGPVVRKARIEGRMTLRALAKQVRVSASYIALIENDERRPSMSLINRLNAALGIDSKTLLVLAYPEARQVINNYESPETRSGTWKNFASNHALHRRHCINRGELRILKQIAAFGKVTRPGHFIFILNSIRQASEE